MAAQRRRIAGATGTTYITTQADVGSVISVRASYTDRQGQPESVDSAATAAVTNVNDLPVANNDGPVSVDEGSSINIDLDSNDTDTDGDLDPNSITITSGPTNGTVTVLNDGTGRVLYTHNGSETTSDVFTYTIKDISGATSNTATVIINVTPVDDAPVAENDTATTQGDPVTIGVLKNDVNVDGSAPQITSFTQPGNGTVKLQ